MVFLCILEFSSRILRWLLDICNVKNGISDPKKKMHMSHVAIKLTGRPCHHSIIPYSLKVETMFVPENQAFRVPKRKGESLPTSHHFSAVSMLNFRCVKPWRPIICLLKAAENNSWIFPRVFPRHPNWNLGEGCSFSTWVFWLLEKFLIG